MAGKRKEVRTQIKAINGKCLYTCRYGHAFNLVVADTVKSVKCIGDALEVVS